MLELLNLLKDTPLPVLFIICGLIGLVWGVVGTLHHTLPVLTQRWQRGLIGGLGSFLFLLGTLIYIFPIVIAAFGPPPAQSFTTPSPLPTITSVSTITSGSTASATSGPTASAGTSFPPKGASLVVSDSLQNNSGNSWIENDTCVFRGNAYHALNQTPNSPPNECYAQTLPTSINTQKIAVQVDMRILSGNYGGLGFGTVSGDRYYFSVNTSNQYQINYPGHGWFSCYSGPNGPQPQPGQRQTLCPTSDYSPTQLIQLQMVIQGNTVSFYINGKLDWVGPNLGISPGTAIFAAGFFENNTDLSFQNLKIWQLS